MRFCLTALILLIGSRLARAETIPLGVVFKGEPTPLELTYTNRGKATVHIAQVSPSCDCIEVLQVAVDVPAGADVKIPLVHHAENTGTVEVTVRLLGDKPSELIKTYTIAGFVTDHSWLLSPREALGGGFVLIDIRSPDQFAQLHIPRSLNIPSFALDTRSDLRGRKLVLLDDGVSPADLLARVAGLRNEGYAQVFALNGGLPAWIRASGKVEGPRASVLSVAKISAAEFAWAGRNAKWRVVAIDGASIPPDVVADVVTWRATDNIGRTLASLSGDGAEGIPPNILIVAPGNGSYPKIEAQLGKARPEPVFYLNGGAKSLVLFHAEQVGAAQHTSQLYKTKLAQNTPIIAGACSSCRH